MQTNDEISLRSASSFRAEARSALRGKWKAALLVSLVLLLMAGSIIGAQCSYSTSDELSPYWELNASIGPFSSVSYWRDGRLYSEANNADGTFYPLYLPYSPLFVAAAALTALLFLILSPISSLGQLRLQIGVLEGRTPDFSVLHTPARQYWLFVRTALLLFWKAFWPTLVLFVGAGVSAAVAPDMPVLMVVLILAAVVLLIVRVLNYAAASYLIAAHPDLTAREAVRTSAQLMKGRKGRFVCLSLSFIGWELLYALVNTLLLELLGSTPLILPILAHVPLMLYINTASIAFLRDAEYRWLNPTVKPEIAETPASDSGDEPSSDTK